MPTPREFQIPRGGAAPLYYTGRRGKSIRRRCTGASVSCNLREESPSAAQTKLVSQHARPVTKRGTAGGTLGSENGGAFDRSIDFSQRVFALESGGATG